MRQLGHGIEQCGEAFGRDAALRLLTADVDLEQDVLHELPLGCDALDLLGEAQAVDRLDEPHLADQVLDLVRLERPDEVHRDAGTVRLTLGLPFLHPVLTEEPDAAVDGLIDQDGVDGLGHGHKGDVLRTAAALIGGLCDIGCDACVVLTHLCAFILHLHLSLS